jgi:thiamine-monophosphate kinase
LLIEGVHFDLAYMPLKHLGYKAVVKYVRYLCNECQGNSNHSFCRSIQPFSIEALEELFGIAHAAVKNIK